MGLFRRAEELASRSTESLLSRLAHAHVAASESISQDELDRLLTGERQAGRQRAQEVMSCVPSGPARIPRTWSAVGGEPQAVHAATLDQNELDASLKNAQPASPLRDALMGVRRRGPTIEGCVCYFAKATEVLGTDRASLLVLEPRHDSYLPLASQGFDDVTLSRLRIPKRYSDAMQGLARGDMIDVSDREELSRFDQFFSAEDYAAVDRLTFAPFGASAIAIILVADATAATQGALKGLAEAVPEDVGTIRSRLAPGSRVLDELGYGRVEAKLRGTGTPLLAIDLEAFGQEFRSRNQSAVSERISDDMAAVAAAMLAVSGVPARVDGRQILLAAEPDVTQIAHHQLTAALHRQFYGSRVAPKALPAVVTSAGEALPD